MKFSSFFITRPIFAIVLSLLIVVAGAAGALQAADQRVSRRRAAHRGRARGVPGANPKVIAETVASPLEQQMNGVDGMLYMFSQATSDGALTLTITFALGTDLDNAQVQVQNRVAQTLPRLPQDVQRIGVTTEKASPDFIMVVHLVSPDERYDMLYLSNYAHLQVKDEITRLAGRRRRAGLRRRRIQHAGVAGSGRLASRQLTTSDVVRAIREQNVQVAAGVLGAPPAPSDAAFQLSINTQGRLTSEAEFGNIIVRATDDGQITHLSRRRAPRARIEPLLAAQPPRQQAGGGDRRLPAARHQRAPGLERRARDDGAPEEELSARRRLPHRLRPDGVRPRIDQRGRPHAVRGDSAGRDRGRGVPADLARLDHPAGRGPGLADRHLRGDARSRVLAQHAVALRPGAGHRHRRGRRDRGGGERGAAHRARPAADGCDQAGDGGGVRARSSPSPWCSARCSCRRRSSAGSPASSTGSSR